MALLSEGKREEAVSFLAQASTVRPDHRATTLLVATTSARMGNSKTAREVFQRALEQQPGKDILVETLAGVEAQLGNLEQALDLVLKHKFQPTHQTYSLLHLYRGIRLSLAQKEASAGNYEAALNHVRAAAAPPTSLGVDDFATIQSSRLLFFEALLHTHRQDPAAAAAAWKAAAATRDDDIEGEGLFRAIALFKTGEKEKAEAWFKEFPAINNQRKTDSNLELRLHAFGLDGIYQAFLGKDPQARRNFERALDVDPLYLYARQSQAWLDAGLLRFPAQ